MKKKYLTAACLALLTLGSLASCGHSKTATVYKVILDRTAMTTSVSKLDMNVYEGNIRSLSVDDIMTPANYSLLTDTAAASGDIDKVSVTVDGTTYNYAKYISIGGYYFEGVASDEEKFTYTFGEYVDYLPMEADNPTITDSDLFGDDEIDDASDFVNGLFYYIWSINLDDVYKLGSNCQWYYDNYLAGNYRILKKTEYGTAKQGITSNEVADSSLTNPTVYTKSSDDYTGSDKTTWTKNINDFTAYFTGDVFYQQGSSGTHNTCVLSKGDTYYHIAVSLGDEDGTLSVDKDLVKQDGSGNVISAIYKSFAAFADYYEMGYNGYYSVEKASYGAY